MWFFPSLVSLLYLTDIVAQLTSRILNKAGARGDITSSHECFVITSHGAMQQFRSRSGTPCYLIPRSRCKGSVSPAICCLEDVG